MIHHLFDALDVGNKLLCQLLLEEGSQATPKHEDTLFVCAADSANRMVRTRSEASFGNCDDMLRCGGFVLRLGRHWNGLLGDFRDAPIGQTIKWPIVLKKDLSGAEKDEADDRPEKLGQASVGNGR
jgi:hypothetical protein